MADWRSKPRIRGQKSDVLIAAAKAKRKEWAASQHHLRITEATWVRWTNVKDVLNARSHDELAVKLLDICYENLLHLRASSADRRRKKLPAEFDNYILFCKSCGSDSIEVTAKAKSLSKQTSVPSVGGVRVKIEHGDNNVGDENGTGGQSGSDGNDQSFLTGPRPTNLVCNVSVAKSAETSNEEEDASVPYKKRRKKSSTKTADKTVTIADETNDTATALTEPTAENDETERLKKKTKQTKSNDSSKDSVENNDDKLDKSKSGDEELDGKNESDEDSGRRRSTRLKGKDRISFIKMIELDISDEDLENSEDDMEVDEEDDECEDDDDDSEVESENSDTEKKERRFVKKGEDDPDFDPETDDEDIGEEVNDEENVEESVEEIVDDDAKPKGRRGRKRLLWDESGFWKIKQKQKLTVKEKEAKRKEIERKKERARQLKELREIYRSAIQKCEDVTVKLEDHEDKYELTMFTSQSQKDRNVDLEQKSYYRYTCKLCDGQFNASDKASMENHIKQHLQGLLTCVDCGVTFSRPLLLFHHRVDNHIEKFYTCEFCAEQFYTHRSLQVHLAKKHDQKPYKCPKTKCLEYFSCRADKKKHVIVAHPELAAQCEKCGEFFFGQDRLQCHIKGTKCREKSSTEGNKIPCEVCGKIVLRAGMKKHMETVHLKIHSHKCEVCSFTTNSTQSIKHHRMRHTGVHPFKCQLCDFSCVQDYQLKSHMRTHTGEKPYKCDQCSYASAWNVQLKEHRKAHQSPTQSTCDICNITFKHERGITLHMKKHHSNQASEADVKKEKSAASEVYNSNVVRSDGNVNQRLGTKIIVVGSSQLDGATGSNQVSQKREDKGQLEEKQAHAIQYVVMKQTEYHTDLSGTPKQGEHLTPEQTKHHSPKQVEHQSPQQVDYSSPDKLVEYHLPKQTEYDTKEYGISHTEYVSTTEQPYSVEYDSTPAEYIVHISCQPDYMPAEQVVTTTTDSDI
ncbi:zinc finger Y-chromosomal protein 1-like isoform X2 [Pecten maximus]|uniref:zinc finger Y-chromosomal protein 1-like isoform X2 n=1 Tax=Pecten maximus TaxID=6579 RepID=UPI001458D274|nr:zinc finger Y-chromosomal protein 1-like isoform X2 [Pecten maximus]XP_033733393.1 zinc finger Y-chromosomal protein 1-like isoform X2 [Pecten maximus]